MVFLYNLRFSSETFNNEISTHCRTFSTKFLQIRTQKWMRLNILLCELFLCHHFSHNQFNTHENDFVHNLTKVMLTKVNFIDFKR